VHIGLFRKTEAQEGGEHWLWYQEREVSILPYFFLLILFRIDDSILMIIFVNDKIFK
jgi:hypothetical protein|tara:strand:- start:1259 stop:1429 length:171 start_codon:yes stop_codon:yes gene_type:complete